MTGVPMTGIPKTGELLAGTARVSATWLGLREAADAAARAVELVELVRHGLAGAPRLVIHDLGSGTGSMGRWLAPQLPGRQHWIMYDRDPELLAHAATAMVGRAADGALVTVETRVADVTRLRADDLRGGSLVTASALLDLLTGDEVDRIAAACVGAGCTALLTTSVAGPVTLTPADPLDAAIGAAFNAHQRRTVDGRRLLGPDAAAAAVDAFAQRGVAASVRPGPWRLGAGEADLSTEWFLGWLAAACEQQPELTGPVVDYAQRRLAEAAAGQLEVVVAHTDLVATCS